jgi:hypothetical protein
MLNLNLGSLQTVVPNYTGADSLRICFRIIIHVLFFYEYLKRTGNGYFTLGFLSPIYSYSIFC